MKEEIKIGETYLVRKMLHGFFHARVECISKGLLGKIYYCRYTKN